MHEGLSSDDPRAYDFGGVALKDRPVHARERYALRVLADVFSRTTEDAEGLDTLRSTLERYRIALCGALENSTKRSILNVSVIDGPMFVSNGTVDLDHGAVTYRARLSSDTGSCCLDVRKGGALVCQLFLSLRYSTLRTTPTVVILSLIPGDQDAAPEGKYCLYATKFMPAGNQLPLGAFTLQASLNWTHLELPDDEKYTEDARESERLSFARELKGIHRELLPAGQAQDVARMILEACDFQNYIGNVSILSQLWRASGAVLRIPTNYQNFDGLPNEVKEFIGIQDLSRLLVAAADESSTDHAAAALAQPCSG